MKRAAAEPLRILLIDPNEHGLVARRTVLDQHGHKVTAVTGAQEGLEAFAARPFDLVITKYRMAEVSGPQVIRKLRQQAPRVPIILLSGYVETLSLTEKSTGADVVLAKGPSEVRDLLRAIARLSRRVAAKPPGRAGPSPRTGRRKGLTAS